MTKSINSYRLLKCTDKKFKKKRKKKRKLHKFVQKKKKKKKNTQICAKKKQNKHQCFEMSDHTACNEPLNAKTGHIIRYDKIKLVLVFVRCQCALSTISHIHALKIIYPGRNCTTRGSISFLWNNLYQMSLQVLDLDSFSSRSRLGKRLVACHFFLIWPTCFLIFLSCWFSVLDIKPQVSGLAENK